MAKRSVRRNSALEENDLDAKDLTLVRRLIFERIVEQRGVEAAALVWIMSAEMVQEYLEATIVSAVSRVAKADAVQAKRLGQDMSRTVTLWPAHGARRSDRTFLRRYGETCVIAEHGVGAVPRLGIDRAIEAAVALYNLASERS